jgi:hypothetical protein
MSVAQLSVFTQIVHHKVLHPILLIVDEDQGLVYTRPVDKSLRRLTVNPPVVLFTIILVTGTRSYYVRLEEL